MVHIGGNLIGKLYLIDILIYSYRLQSVNKPLTRILLRRRTNLQECSQVDSQFLAHFNLRSFAEHIWSPNTDSHEKSKVPGRKKTPGGSLRRWANAQS